MRGAFLHNCRAEPGTRAFLRLDGASTRASAIGNDLAAAARPFDVPPELVREGALFETANRTASG